MVINSGLAALGKVGVTVTILAIVFTQVELSALANSLARVEPYFLLMAVALEVALLLSGVQRWRSVAGAFGEKLALRPALTYMLIALFINLGLPSVVGLDAARTWKLRRSVTSLGLAARIVITDRLCSLVALLLVIAFGLPRFSKLSDVSTLTSVGILFGISVTIIIFSVAHSVPFSKRVAHIPAFIHFNQLSHDLYNTLTLGTLSFAITAWGVVNHLFRVAIVFCIGLGFGLALSLWDAFTLVPLGLLIAMIPISIGGWGVREGAFIVLFGFAGIASADALALSVVYGLVGLLTALVGGLVWMAERRSYR